jgi:CBS domain-containing protein
MDRSPLQQFISQRLGDVTLTPPAVVAPSTSVRDAVTTMQRDGHSCVLAMEGDRLAGIFTERDVLTKCMATGFDWDQPLTAAALTRNPRTIPFTSSVAEAIATMQQHRYRSLPVVRDGRVAGLVRLGDLLKQFAETYPDEVLNLPPRPHQIMEKPEGG